jgi:hypothetical protein
MFGSPVKSSLKLAMHIGPEKSVATHETEQGFAHFSSDLPAIRKQPTPQAAIVLAVTWCRL